MTDDSVVGFLNDIGKGSQAAWGGFIASREKLILSTADHIVRRRGVAGFLHIGTVEVVVWPAREGRETQYIPKVWTEICQMIYIETWVDVSRCGHDVFPYIAPTTPFGAAGNFPVGVNCNASFMNLA